MFLFRNNYFFNKEEIKIEKEVEENNENFVVESVYLLSVNGKPIGYKKTLDEVYKKVEELEKRYRLSLMQENKKVFSEMDTDYRLCRVYSRGYNFIINYDTLEYIITWEKIKNN